MRWPCFMPFDGPTDMAPVTKFLFASRNAPSNFLQPVLNVSRVWPRDLEPLGGDFDCAKSATLREKQKVNLLLPSHLFSTLKRHKNKAVHLRQPRFLIHSQNRFVCFCIFSIRISDYFSTVNLYTVMDSTSSYAFTTGDLKLGIFMAFGKYWVSKQTPWRFP